MKTINLASAEIGKSYRIKEVNVKNVSLTAQLKNLGFVSQERLQLLNHNYGKKSFLVKVMGVNYAIDKKVCEGIIVCYE